MTGRKHSEPKIAENDAVFFTVLFLVMLVASSVAGHRVKENKELLADESCGG